MLCPLGRCGSELASICLAHLPPVTVCQGAEYPLSYTFVAPILRQNYIVDFFSVEDKTSVVS